MKTSPKEMRRILFVAALVIVAVILLAPRGTQGDSEVYQRVYPNAPEELQRAVDTLKPETKGRLPVLDGFVIPQGQPLERYTRGYFECTLQVLPSGSGQAIVRATAKITAWYTDPEANRSGYQILPSNGRLESDALDRIEEALAGSAVSRPSDSSSSSSSKISPAPSSGGLQPSLNRDAPVAPKPARPPLSIPASFESVDSIRARREANERKALELTTEEKNLEDILHNQARPTDLAVVKKQPTPIYAKPLEGSPVLFSADVHDEFQVLETEGSWVHVKISGASRGWLRQSQVSLTADYASSSAVRESENETGNKTVPSFKIEKEETRAFSGKWQALEGKSVRVVWVEPPFATNGLTSPRQKKSFAKDVLLKTYAKRNLSESVEGVVVLFDSADGGQISATIASLARLADGSLTDADFWTQCSLDPPDLFANTPKPAEKSAPQKN
jgi:hypothetical protein